MKAIYFVVLIGLLASCVVGNSHIDVSEIHDDTRGGSSQIGRAQVSSVAISNNQLIVQGKSFLPVQKISITGDGFSEDFSIESITENKIVANGLQNISFKVGSIFNLVISDSNGSASFSVTFELQNGAIVDAHISGTANISQSKIQNLTTDLASKLNIADIDIDPALAANSDTKVSSQKAVKAFVANEIDANGKWGKSGSDIYFNNGSVGIGTSSPSKRLEVYGTSQSTSTVSITRNSDSNFGSYLEFSKSRVDGLGVSGDRIGEIKFIAPDSAGSSLTYSRIYTKSTSATSGNASGDISFQTLQSGVESTALLISDYIYANRSLQLEGSQTVLMRNSNSSSGHGMNFYKRRSSGAVQSGDNLAWISAQGHDGTNWGSYSSAISFRATESQTASAAGSQIQFQTTQNGTTSPFIRMTVHHDGNVGIGTTAPSHLLHVNGVARSTQASFDTSSDRRVKDNIRDVQNGLEMIMKLRPVRYEYIKEYVSRSRELAGVKTGFVAQEVALVDPTMVKKIVEKYSDKVIEDFNVLNTANMIPLLVSATQEQEREISSLRNMNEKLESKVNQMKEVLCEIKPSASLCH
ncbi:endosialidase chaperone [Bacteriovorax sp. BSW11_IV]|uniref:tail fiber domain-containing protein n=1 Tax=Bacteriovorax sp. BSW11_IV TaxID=1353529 RepID=UPI00038A3064|nr:tail fiber domain-containing protein [Bacteriovorax sp. BSW11_IV]EQC44593.1 endosialidase chaperone [Bacteriovorax sp. BSW11_IV]